LGQNHGLTELPIVNEIRRNFVVGIGAHGEAGKNLLVHANIEIMRPFRQHGIIGGNHRLLCGVVEQGELVSSNGL
jgi:hypothetical protein